MKKNTKEEKILINTLKSNANIIEKISNERTKSMLDIYKHGKGFLIENDWQEEIVAHYNFFITMIGLIEANIISIAREIDGNTDKERLVELGDKLDILVSKRYRIIDNYFDIQSNQDLSIVRSILKEPFVYQNLDKIYGDLEVNNFKYNLHQEFVNAYNIGSILAQNCNVKKVFLEYTKLCYTFKKTKVNNQKLIHNTGNEKVLKKIINDKNEIAKNRENY